MLSRATIYSQRASSRTSGLLSDAIAVKSNVPKLFTAGKCARAGKFTQPAGTWLRAYPPLDHAALPVNQFQLGKPQKIAGMIEPVMRRLGGDFLIFTQKGWQFELAQMMREQHLGWRRAGWRRGCCHAALPETKTM